MKKTCNSEGSCYSPSFDGSLDSSQASSGIGHRLRRKKSNHPARLTKSTDTHQPTARLNHGSLPDLQQHLEFPSPPAAAPAAALKSARYTDTYTGSYSSSESSRISSDNEEENIMEFPVPIKQTEAASPIVNNPVSPRDKSPTVSYQFSLDPISVLDADEQYNGLLAPGALADEKQQKRANGTWLERLLHALFKSVPDKQQQTEEAKLFKPIIFDPSHPTVVHSTDSGDDPDPGCCCIQIKYWVGIWFVLVLMGCLVGFFVWPRVPSLSITSLVALEPAQVIYDTHNSSFGLQMPLQINYEIRSGNFYPLQITHVQVSGFDGVTGNKIIDTRLSNIPVKPLRLQFRSSNTTLSYLTSDLLDPALTDLFGKCAPQASAPILGLPADGGRQRSLTVRFQIKVDVGNLGWIKQPTVTLNQNLQCPQ